MTNESFDFSLDPFKNFEIQFSQVKAQAIPEPFAFTLGTCGKDGKPSVRTLLLKDFSEKGFVFFTNYNSEKAQDLLENPQASMLFYWVDPLRQVRIEGTVEKISRIESEKYFKTRATISQIGAWASNQSAEIESSDVLKSKVKEFENRFSGGEVPCPPHWGGYLLKPNYIEFWFGRSGRLHDRFCYERLKDSSNANHWRRFLKSP